MRAIVLGCLILVSAAAGYAQLRGVVAPLDPSVSAQIDGIVIDDQSGSPLANVNVGISGSSLATTTDSNGKFHLEGIRPGTSFLLSSRLGFVGARASELRRTVTVEAGQRLQEVIIRMLPAPIVTGRIVDEQGRPVADAQIVPFRRGYDFDGQIVRKYLSGQQTNDLGEFRLNTLDPGEYGFKVEPPRTRDTPGNTDTRSTAYSSIYYPGTSDPAKASTLHVESGKEIRLGTMAVTSGRGFSLHIINANETGLREGGSFHIRRVGDSNNSVRTILFDRDQQEGTIGNVLPGRYELFVSLGGSRIEQSFEMGQNDRSVNTRVPKATSLRMRAVRRSDDGALHGVSGVAVEFHFDAHMGAAPTAVRKISSSDGTVTASPFLGPVSYKVQIGMVPQGFYVTSVQSEGRDLLREGIQVREAPEVEITVMVEDRAGRIRGAVTDSKGRAVPGAIVALIPDDREQRAFYFSVTADGNGKFDIQGGPGNYRLFAWREMDGYAFRNAEFLKEYDARAQAVRLERASDLTMNSKILD